MNKWIGHDELFRELDLNTIILILNNGKRWFQFTYGKSETIRTKKDMFLQLFKKFIICLSGQFFNDGIVEKYNGSGDALSFREKLIDT